MQHYSTPLLLRNYSIFNDRQGVIDCDCDTGFNEFSLLVRGRLTATSDYKDAPPLSSWLHLTDRCNLRCTYCYLPHEKADMGLETGKAAIDKIFHTAQQNNYSKVKLKYAGGEPTLRFPLLVELHEYAAKLAKQQNIALDAIVLSNGTLLTEEMIGTLKSLGIRLMISLDGLGEYQDGQRCSATGGSTAKAVLQGIELAQAQGLVPHISVTVSGKSAPGLAELTEWLLARELPFSFNFYRANNFSQAHTELQLEEQAMIDGLLAAFKVIEQNLPQHSLLGCLGDRANLASPHLRTCSVGRSYLVFNHLGEVSKCQMKMDQPVASVNDDNILQRLQSDTGGIQNLSVEDKAGCRDCDWKYWCTGGCPLETHRVTGRYDVQSPNCAIYKAIFPQIVRLEGLRLLRAHKFLPEAAAA